MTAPTHVDPKAAAHYFVDVLGCTAFPVWGSRNGKCLCGDPHDDTREHGSDNIGKHPASRRGFKDATDDTARIDKFLDNPGTPNYGLNPPAGVVVIDVDGAEGLAKWESLQAAHGPLPVTLTTLTAHGRHYFFHWPDEVGPMPQGKMYGFVTRRHDDGYIIGPGSVHPTGFEYDTLRQSNGMPYQVESLPEAWARAALTRPRPIVVGGALPQPGERHDWLLRRARHYAGTVRDPDALKAALMADNAKLSQPKSESAVDRAIGKVLAKFDEDPVDEETGERIQDPGLDLLPLSTGNVFPETPTAEAFEGLLGECVEDLAGGTDASAVGLLGSLVAICGAMVPGQAYFHRLQTSSPFVALVGESSTGRKGTAMTRAVDAISDAIGSVYVSRVILDGLASGEGLVSALDYKQVNFKNEQTVGLVFEEEYATLLAARSREGSTLDPKMRAAFDGGPLSNRRSGEHKVVQPPYWLPALIAITPDELRSRLETGAFLSGSANRWLYLPVRRREVVPTNSPPILSEPLRDALVAARRTALGTTTHVLDVDPDVITLLTEYADFLPTATFGLAHELSRRLAVIAFRVGLIHALVERSPRVTRKLVSRAIALTEYGRASIPWVFGDMLGNKDADLLLRHLQAKGQLAKTEITRGIIRDPIRQQAAIDELLRWGHADLVSVGGTGGRNRKELVPNTGSRSGWTYFHDSVSAANPDAHENRGTNGTKPVDAWNKALGGLGINVEESWNKVEQRPGNTLEQMEQSKAVDSQAAVVDHVCRDYQGHKGEPHKRPPAGPWSCTICYPEDFA